MALPVLKITANGKTFTADLVDNSSTLALVELLKNRPIEINMEDYASMEKVGSIGTMLPRNDVPHSTSPGDIILYQDHYLVIYYGNNHYTFTPVGKIENTSATELKTALGQGNVKVTVSL